MSRRPRLAVGVVAIAAALAGCGGDGKLAWQGAPKLFIPADIPGDRLLTGTVRNTGEKAINVKVPDLRLIDGGGRRVPASAQFIRTFAHGLIFPDLKRRDEQPLVEQRRIGQQVLLKPGQTAPVIVTWHAPRGPAPAKVDYGKGTLPVPADSTATRARG